MLLVDAGRGRFLRYTLDAPLAHLASAFEWPVDGLGDERLVPILARRGVRTALAAQCRQPKVMRWLMGRGIFHLPAIVRNVQMVDAVNDQAGQSGKYPNEAGSALKGGWTS